MTTFYNNADQVQSLFVGYFGRAADPAGARYWVSSLNGGGTTLAGEAASFAVQPEATGRYPYLANPLASDPTTFIDQVYLNLFNRRADADGLAYWTARLTAAAGNPNAVGNMVLDIISGATGFDDQCVRNKVSVAGTFTTRVEAAAIGWNAAIQAQSVTEIAATSYNPATVATQDAATTAYIASGAWLPPSPPPIPPPIAIDPDGDGFVLILEVAGFVTFSQTGSLGYLPAGDTVLVEQPVIKQGYLLLTTGGATSAPTAEWQVVGTAEGDLIDLRDAGERTDYVLAGGGDDTVRAGPGDDLVFGGTGNDSLFGNQGDDLIYGGDGNDEINGGQGNDFLYGDEGDDVIDGGSTGADVLYGGLGNDWLLGDTGDDFLSGDEGADFLTGGPGDDTFYFWAAADTRSAAYAGTNTTWANIDRITDFSGNGAAAGDGIQLGRFAGTWGVGITFSTDSTAIVTAVAVAGGAVANIEAIFAQVQAASPGIASTSAVAQVYDVTLAAAYAGANRLLIVNNATAAIDSADAVINITGITGALNAQDFTFL